ncbi:hypothetical protein SDC9_142961 [bioreactor metagenome]|uniref:Uncharacterized protein n=1 Tax=bioreactor metagenome TaxID=1076179 RepID=A0A645E2L7_9ZZZZ
MQKQGVTAKDLKKVEHESAMNAIDFAVQGMLASFALVLHDKWGWGQVRIKRLLDQVDEQFDSIDKELLSIDDVQKVVFDEIGIELK